MINGHFASLLVISQLGIHGHPSIWNYWDIYIVVKSVIQTKGEFWPVALFCTLHFPMSVGKPMSTIKNSTASTEVAVQWLMLFHISDPPQSFYCLLSDFCLFANFYISITVSLCLFFIFPLYILKLILFFYLISWLYIHCTCTRYTIQHKNNRPLILCFFFIFSNVVSFYWSHLHSQTSPHESALSSEAASSRVHPIPRTLIET